ncbi:MAG: hypothetical protein ACM3ZR_04430 [Pseudomonadota bacterium]
MKFDRVLISNVNISRNEVSGTPQEKAGSKTVAVPEEETFKHVFQNAIKGNEMAAVLLDEWQRHCEPRDDGEKQIVNMINKAANSIFK